jgi:uncharacterized repeat protein (TIGR01451 family)
MKNLILSNKNIRFSITATVILTSACVLISVFAVIGTVNAAGTIPIGGVCNKNSECVSNNCLFGHCFAQPFSNCNISSDCAGTNTNTMGCFNKGSGNKCYGRHGYPCGNYREDPVCAPEFHCDINGNSGPMGYNYCEADHAWCSITASPTSIAQGGSSVLTWNSIKAVSCIASGAWSGSKALSGTQSVSPNSDSTYKLTCYNSVGADYVCSAAINVSASIPTVSCAVSASPDSGTAPVNDVDITASVGGSATGNIVYQFDCTNDGTYDYTSSATSTNPFTRSNLCDYASAGTYTVKARVTRQGVSTTCTDTVTVSAPPTPTVSCALAANPNSGTVPLNNVDLTATVGGTATGTINYKFDCNNDGVWDYVFDNINDNPKIVINACNYSSAGTHVARARVERSTANSAQCYATINIDSVQNTPTCSIYASPSSITNGNYSTLNWTSSNATSCYASNAWSGNKSLSGSQSVSPSNNSTYALICSNGYYSTTCSATIDVTTVYNNPNLSIEKLVRNTTNSNTSFYDTVNANLGDEVEFLIKINSIGTGTVYNAKVKDILPSGLTYVSGSATVNGSYLVDGIINGWISIGDIIQGSSKEIKFKAKVSSVIPGVSGGSATINVTNQNIQTSNNVSISTSGRNITRNGNWGNSFQAYYGDEAEFSVQVINNTAYSLTNVIIKETMPSNLSLIKNSTAVDGMNWGGDIIGAGLNLGTLAPGQSKTIKFRVTVLEQTSNAGGSVTLTNTAYASADNVSQLYDNASIIISSGDVLGAITVATGMNLFGLIFLVIVSCLIAIVVYCRVREDKLSGYLSKEKGNRFLKWLIGLYFNIKLRFKLANLRFKQVYL